MAVPRFAEYLPRERQGLLSAIQQPLQAMSLFGQLQTQQLQQQQLQQQMEAVRQLAPLERQLTEAKIAAQLAPEIPKEIKFANAIMRARKERGEDYTHEMVSTLRDLGQIPESTARKELAKMHVSQLSDIGKGAESAQAMLPSIRTYKANVKDLPDWVMRKSSSWFTRTIPTEQLSALVAKSTPKMLSAFINKFNKEREIIRSKEEKEMESDLIKEYGVEKGKKTFAQYRKQLEIADSAQTRLLVDLLNGITGKGSLSDSEREVFARALPRIAQGKDASLEIANYLEAISQRKIARREFYSSLKEDGVSVENTNRMWDSYMALNPIISRDGKFNPQNVKNWTNFLDPNNVGGSGLNLNEIKSQVRRTGKLPMQIISENVPMARRLPQEPKISGIGREERLQPTATFEAPPEREFVPEEYSGGVAYGKTRLTKKMLETVADKHNRTVEELKELLRKNTPDFREL